MNGNVMIAGAILVLRYYGLHKKDFRMNNTDAHVTSCDVELLI